MPRCRARDSRLSGGKGLAGAVGVIHETRTTSAWLQALKILALLFAFLIGIRGLGGGFRLLGGTVLDDVFALTETGRELSRRCDALIDRIAESSLSARDAVALALATRFYKRIQGHVLNLLSSLTMPLHKLDYFDETLIDR